MYGLASPTQYVKMTPILFESWCEWADTESKREPKKTTDIRPFGESEGPSWMRTEFDGLEAFFLHYMDLIGVEV